MPESEALRRLKRAVLMEEPLCRLHRARGRMVEATQVDHIVPRREGGADERPNLQPLCAACHSYKTATEDGGWGRTRRRVPPEGV
jgi:5-methylcytosine-specific restriction protein A